MKLNTVKCDLHILESLLKKLDSKIYTDVGILGNAGSQDGMTIASIGAVHEFGSISGNIPERSFIRMPLENGQEEVTKKLAPKLQGYLEKQDIKGFMTLVGIECEAQIQAAFDTGGKGTWAAIKPETIRRKKGSAAILIDTGLLRKSITSKVGGG